MKTILTGNYAVSYAVLLSDVQVIAAYPITPQTQIVEKLSEMCAKNQLSARYINVESEHSAMAACIGASATGARAFTATSSQGLAYMHELLHWASRARLPIVMANVNRAMAPGWNMWVDQNDSLSQRDTGWMQIYCKNNQEVIDSIIMAYKISEHVLLPTMVNLDAFVLSHTSETVDIPDNKKVKDFLSDFCPKIKLDINNPRTFGTLTDPDIYTEFQYKIQKSMEEAEAVIEEVGEIFNEFFGRYYKMVEAYKIDDAEDVIITTSTMAETASLAVDLLREYGVKVGLLRLRYLRPFPRIKICKFLTGKRCAIVLDRNISFGAQGIFCQEIRAAIYDAKNMPDVYGYILGLGGRDVTPETITGIYKTTKADIKSEELINWGDVKL